MDDTQRERAENAERITRKLHEGQPFEDIFPAKVWTPPPPDPFEAGVLSMVACDRPSPHDGTTLRYYRVECAHFRTDITLPDMTVDDDPAVFRRMVDNARVGMAANDGLCLCQPRTSAR